MEPIIAIVVLVGLAYVLLAVPHRRRQRAHQAMQDAVEVGDEIITAGGMHAIVREDDGEELGIEIAPGVLVRLDRRAVAAVAVELPAAEETEPPAADGAQPVNGGFEPPGAGEVETPAEGAQGPGRRGNDRQQSS